MTRTYHTAIAKIVLRRVTNYGEVYSEQTLNDVTGILESAYEGAEPAKTTASITPAGEGEPRTR